MTEAEALRARRSLLFERLCQAADEIRRIDRRLMWIECNECNECNDVRSV